MKILTILQIARTKYVWVLCHKCQNIVSRPLTFPAKTDNETIHTEVIRHLRKKNWSISPRRNIVVCPVCNGFKLGKVDYKHMVCQKEEL